MLKNIHIIATGGTIASKAMSRTDSVRYVPAVFSIDDLLSEVPGLNKRADVTAEQLYNKQSQDLTDVDVITLAKRVQKVCDSVEVDGVVITMGTDTLEEVAYFLHLTLKTNKPVVVTGAMRPAGVVSADGPLNILNAVIVAADEHSAGRGVMVSMDEHIMCARDVMKSSSYKMDSFRGGDYGVIGNVRNTQVKYFYQSIKKHTQLTKFNIHHIHELPPVDILYMYQGCGNRLLQASIASGARGIVIAGFGNGAIHPDILEYYRQHQEDKLPIMVRASRTPYGGTEGDYGHFDEEIGSIAANDTSPQKARILLRLGLTITTQRAELIRMFAEY
jgi:L-asparaginase